MFEGARHHVDTGSNRLQTFVDSDYAADETRRSMGGMGMLNGGPISWFSVLGETVSPSTLQLVLDKQIQFKYCPTDLQLADMLTKPLDSTKFLKFRDQFLAR